MSLGAAPDCTEGDYKNFAVDGTKTITIHIDGNTSANDTDTDKYFDNSLSESQNTSFNAARAFFIRNDQTIEILGINKITFTDPIEVTLNKGHREEFNQPIITKIIIRTTLAGGSTTNINVRVK